MFAEERKMEILSKLDKEGSVRVDQLAKIYKVTEATIRRDLQDLEDKGFIKRTHGGAVLNDDSMNELSFIQKNNKPSIEKVSIGKLASSLIKDGQTIALDTSTTIIQMLPYIKDKNINVITNSIDIIEALMGIPNIQVISTGGIVRDNTRAMVGPLADASLRNFMVDISFMGANSIDLNHGIACTHVIEAETKKNMINIANKVVFLCESRKFEKINLSKICNLKDLDCIITDNTIDENLLNQYKEKIDILIAK